MTGKNTDQVPRQVWIGLRLTIALRRVASPCASALAIVLIACMIASGYPQAAVADLAGPACGPGSFFGTPCPPPDLLNLGELQGRTLYAATAAQIISLQALEQQAITNTTADHSLTQGDTTAVQTWGRSDALAELWALLIQAIKTAKASRTTDQQNAVDWLTALTQRQGVAAAQAAGREYVKWAGLSDASYESLLASNPSTDSLTNFLGAGVANFGPNNVGGYCNYRSPAPYADEYTGYNDQTCSTPCTSLLGCNPPTPSYDQFVKWGESDVNNLVFGTTDFATVSRSVAVGITFGTAAVAAGVSAAILASTLASVLTGSALATAIFPFAAEALADFGATSLVTAAEAVGAVTAAAVGVIVAVVILAVVIGVLEGIIIFQDAALPGKLATLIHDAPSNTPDLTVAVNDSTKLQSLYSLFIGATLPSPTFTSCDNSDSGIIIIGNTPPSAPCLNAPAVPGPDPSDLEFGITPKNSTTTTYASSMSWHDTIQDLSTTTRVNGHWFLEQVSPPTGSAVSIQSLHIHYTDWSGAERTAWLMGNAASGYKFLSAQDSTASGSPLSSSTCLTDGTCAYSSTIQFVGTDGKDYSASVMAPVLPTISPTTSTNPTEGSPVTFTANGSSPLGLDVTYSWNFNQLNTSIVCLGSGCGVNVAGSQVKFTPTTSGQLAVTLTATDSLGKSTSQSFQIGVADVPPKLQLTPATGSQSCGNNATCDVRVTTLGNAVTVSGTLTHAGSDDTENMTIDWGDGIKSVGSTGFFIIGGSDGTVTLTPSSSTVLGFSSTHTYASTGIHTVGVSASDQSNGSDSTSTSTETDLTPSFTSNASTTFETGQPGTFTLASAGYPAPGLTYTGNLPTGVTLKDNGNGTATLSGTPDAGTGGSYPLTVTFTNKISVAHQSFTLVVNQPAVVSDQPSDEAVQGGTAGSFTASATGYPLPTVHWQSSPDGSTGWADVGGATSTTYAPATSTGENSVRYLHAIFNSTNGTSDTSHTVRFIVDSTAPVTTASDQPAPNGNGWNNTAPSVSLTAADAPGGTASTGSGVASITYSATGAQPFSSTTVNRATTSVPITTEGTTTVTYHAIDKVGNSEGTKTIVVKYDKTPPVVDYLNNVGKYTVDQTITIHCTASDATSGIASTTCKDITGPAYTFTLGQHSYSASATDYAGNMGLQSTSFVVKVTNNTLGTLSQQFVPAAGHPEVMQQALKNALLAKAKGKPYKGFITLYKHLVEAQIGKTITAAQAKVLEGLADTL